MEQEEQEEQEELERTDDDISLMLFDDYHRMI
jgi:hypothetical protein